MRLTFKTLGELDHGIAEEIINQALQTAARDIDDRGEDGAARTVTIDVVMKKDLKAAGKPTVVSLKTQAKLPPTQTGGVVTESVRNGQGVDLYFQPFSPDAPDQPSMFDPTADEEE